MRFKVGSPLGNRGIFHPTELDHCRHLLRYHRGFAARPQRRHPETLAFTSDEQTCAEN